MKRMRKPNTRVRPPRTFGELVTWAFDVTPNSAAAAELVGHLLQQGKIRFSGSVKF